MKQKHPQLIKINDFFSHNDKLAFINWAHKIPCVIDCKDTNDILFLTIKSFNIRKIDLRDLIALCMRYKVDMKQLAVFLNKRNKNWFYDDKIMFWHKKVFTE